MENIKTNKIYSDTVTKVEGKSFENQEEEDVIYSEKKIDKEYFYEESGRCTLASVAYLSLVLFHIAEKFIQRSLCNSDRE